jgi:hypothetical protein
MNDELNCNTGCLPMICGVMRRVGEDVPVHSSMGECSVSQSDEADKDMRLHVD